MSLPDKERFIAIVQTHKRILYKIINAYCKDPIDRQDLEQEILIALWKSLKTYDDKYTLSTWIYRLALNVAISHYRVDVKRKKRTQSLDDNILQLKEDSREELDHNLDKLQKFINALDEFSKAIMILMLDGNSYKEIASILGITETNVATKINRIKKSLKEKFTNQ